MKNQQQLQTQIAREDSLSNSADIFIRLLVSSLLAFLGLGWTLVESVTRLHCQRDSLNSGYCQIIEMRLFGQSTKQDILLREIKNVTYEKPIESEWFNLLITQTKEEIRLNGFNFEQAKTIQSFLKNPNQKDLVLQKLYDRRPYAIFIGGSFLLVSIFGGFEMIRKIKGEQ